MPITKLTPTYPLTDERLAQLRQVVPEAFADGELDWDALRDVLGATPDEEGDGAGVPASERFGLFWPGKRLARRAAATPPQGTLVPVPGEGVDEETTRNIFIEGENLEVLKLLLKSYAGKVKMIYIDPPYNTGNDFVYPDDYSEPVEAYLRRTGQMGEQGELLTTNPRTSGRFHSNWLNMMYPRLVLARQLLREDGVMFVSIDDTEEHNLRQLLGEVFGDENCIATMPWKGRGGRQDSTHLAAIHEFVLLASHSASKFEAGGMPKTDELFPKLDPDRKLHYRTQLLRKWGSNSRRQDRPKLFYPIEAPDGSYVLPMLSDGTDGCWRWGPTRMQKEIRAGNVEFSMGELGWVAYERIWEPTPGEVRTSKFTTWLDDVGTTAGGTKELQGLFGGETPFEFPKPTTLTTRLVEIASPDDDDLVVDFFAGSCTTAHTVLTQTHTSLPLRFIMVQLPEPTPAASAARRAGYATIADIGKERIRRVIARMRAEQAGQLDLQARETPADLGFRVYKLARSNVRAWQPYQGDSTAAVQSLFDQAQSPLVEGWSPGDLLVEIMLQEGFPLDSRVERQPAFAHNGVDCVSSEWCEHRLFVCLDKSIAAETVAALPGALAEKDIFVCLDSALTDGAKLRLDDRLNVKVI